MWNQYTVRFAHEVCDPTSQLWIPGIERVEFKRPPPGHTYLWCDRAIGPIKANAALTSGGIWVGHITPDLPTAYRRHTWEACIVGDLDRQIPPCRMNGTPYGYHKVDQQFFDGFRALFASPLSTLAPVGTPLKYRDSDGQTAGDFNISAVFHIVAGKGQAPHTTDTTTWVRLDGRVLCRTSLVDNPKSNPWLELPLLRPAFKPRSTTSARPAVRAVQWATRAEDREFEPRLGTMKPHTSPYPLSALKMKDIHHLLRLLCPTREMDVICPEPDAEELAVAERAAKARKEARANDLRADDSDDDEPPEDSGTVEAVEAATASLDVGGGGGGDDDDDGDDVDEFEVDA